MVIYDCDLGSSTDDLFALARLCCYVDEDRCTLLGVICDRKGENNTQMAAILLDYYGHPDIPIGIERSYREEAPLFVNYCATDGDSSILLHHNELGYCNSFDDFNKRPDGWVLYRQLLANAPDHSVNIICTGFMTTLSKLLESQADTISRLSGIELVAQKVETIYIMGSSFSEDNYNAKLDYNLDIPSPDYAKAVFQLLPSCIEIIFSPINVGIYLGRYENNNVLADIHDKRNPIFQVYNRFTVDSGQYLWDMLPTIQCIEGEELFHLSGFGKINIVKDSANHIIFTSDKTGNARFQYIPSFWGADDSISFRNTIIGKTKECINRY